jgi:aryl-alcohol dehydrogenase-like predicted oxidoreductase
LARRFRSGIKAVGWVKTRNAPCPRGERLTRRSALATDGARRSLDQQRTIASAIAAGVNYFDTAVQYGDGQSEKNLSRVLRNLKVPNVVVGSKVRLPSVEFGHIANAVSLEGSLSRLSRECVDIFHLHNAITDAGGGEALSVRQVLEDVVPALRGQGKTRFFG